MKPNTHPETGIAFGVIAADRLEDEIVEQLLYGRHAVNISYEMAKAEHLVGARHVFNYDPEGKKFDEEKAIEDFAEDYQNDEPTIEGTKDSVKYQSSWIGGALHFYIFESPTKTFVPPCSPCCPGAGNLNNPIASEDMKQYMSADSDSILAYDVPDDWRRM